MEQSQGTLVTISQLRGVIILTLCMLMVALGAYTYNAITETHYLSGGPTTISVNGMGEVLAKPDIASFNFAVRAEGADAAEAQTTSAEAVNAIMSYLAGEGIEEKDIKTQNYYLNPRYEWTERICEGGGYCPPGEQVLVGYEVSQTINVKVRAIDTAGDLLSGVGDLGATNISNIQFTIDDEDTLKAEARAAAIADAQEKADILAKNLGVKVVRVVNFWEESGYYDPMPYAVMESADMGMGGDMMRNAPSVPTGENTVSASVNITFEVK